eukprot:GHVH01006371.1.p1 GENE.GHVH01006371.1~~GHVH01006371.1.p1  ORF type:complete len:239 (+),score=14.62 GHVH01006371.1:156-872(+)
MQQSVPSARTTSYTRGQIIQSGVSNDVRGCGSWADGNVISVELSPEHRHKRGTVTCRHWKRGRCDLGELCNFAHEDLIFTPPSGPPLMNRSGPMVAWSSTRVPSKSSVPFRERLSSTNSTPKPHYYEQSTAADIHSADELILDPLSYHQQRVGYSPTQPSYPHVSTRGQLQSTERSLYMNYSRVMPSEYDVVDHRYYNDSTTVATDEPADPMTWLNAPASARTPARTPASCPAEDEET